MKRKRKNILFIIMICIGVILGCTEQICYAQNDEDMLKDSELYAKAAVLMDADSGRILYTKNGTDAMANASTTKILTCIVALEYSQMDAVVTASRRASLAPKVHLGMVEGQKFYLKDLLHALMLESYNDCAVAIAEHISGSVEEFAGLMNHKAEEIGCSDTYFITPNGLDATNEKGFHHTTASDLALLMRYCIMQSEKRDEFREITATRSYSFCEIDSGRSYTVTNKNAFLDMMDGAFSGKTGFTGNAGYCYVGALEKEDKTYIVTLLACGWPNNRSYKWEDSKKLFQYGLSNFEKVKLSDIKVDIENIEEILVSNGQSERIGEPVQAKIKIGKVKGYEDILLPKDAELKLIYQIKKEWEAPLLAGTEIGKVFLVVNDEELRTYSLVNVEEIKKIDYIWCLSKVVKQYLKIA